MSLTTKTFIEVPFSFYAYHRYELAPEDVKFLRERHPHDFECTVWIEVRHDDRELEFYLVKEYLLRETRQITDGLFSSDEKFSCEMLADFIYGFLSLKYGVYRNYKIRVAEDGKYAAIKEYSVSS